MELRKISEGHEQKSDKIEAEQGGLEKISSHEDEQAERSFEAEYDQIHEDLLRNKYERETTFEIGQLVTSGGRELIQIFGVEKFVDAIEKAAEEDKGGKKDFRGLYDVIQILEPDKKRRNELFERMDALAESETQQVYEQENSTKEQERDAASALIRDADFGVNGNTLRLRKFAVGSYQRYNTTLAPVLDAISRAFNSVGDHAGIIQDIPRSLHQRFGGDLEGFRDQLEGQEGDISELVAERYKQTDEKKKRLFEKFNELGDRIEAEVAKIRSEVHEKFAEKTLKLIDDLNKLAEADPENKEILKAVEEAAEKELKQYEEAFENELAEKIKKHQGILDRIKGDGALY